MEVSTNANSRSAATESSAADLVPANDQSINKSTAKLREATFLGQPLLLTGENKADYEAFLGAVSAKVQSKDIFEDLWIRDIVYHEWNMLRLRRFTTAHIDAVRQQALATLLRPLLPSDMSMADSLYTKADTLALQFTQGDKAAIKQVEILLETAGLTFDAVLAEGMASKIETIERFDRMAIAAQAWRDAALRELNRRRFTLAQELRRTFKQIDDGTYYIDEPSIVGKEPV